jgi:hypothetical protein
MLATTNKKPNGNGEKKKKQRKPHRHISHPRGGILLVTEK